MYEFKSNKSVLLVLNFLEFQFKLLKSKVKKNKQVDNRKKSYQTNWFYFCR